MKNTIKVLTIMVLMMSFVCIASCKKDSLRENYPGLEKDHIIKEITPTELVSKINNKETFIVVLGFPNCPWCQQLLPCFDEVASTKSQDIQDNTFYCDLKDMRDNEESADKECYNFLYQYAFLALDTEKNRINAPTILTIKNGVLLGWHLDTVEGHDMDESGTLPELTEEQRTELDEILNDLFNKLS